jgi:hypothetical protein
MTGIDGSVGWSERASEFYVMIVRCSRNWSESERAYKERASDFPFPFLSPMLGWTTHGPVHYYGLRCEVRCHLNAARLDNLPALLLTPSVRSFSPCSAHMSEETRDAARSAPIGVLMSVWASAIFGFFFIVS